MDEGRARHFSESEDETRDHEDAEAGGEHERQHSERPYERENDQQGGHRSGSAAGFGAELRGVPLCFKSRGNHEFLREDP